jgi:hypothetical protein
MSHIRGACIDPHGYDAGKKIKGKKRHILVDTLGLLLHAIVHPADIQDRDGGVLVMATLFGMFPLLKTLFADSGYQGPKFAKALAKFCRISTLKSSNVPIRSADLWSCPNAGSSSAPSRGSIAAEGSPRIGRISTERRSRSCASPQSASCSENSAIQREVSGRTLRVTDAYSLLFGAVLTGPWLTDKIGPAKPESSFGKWQSIFATKMA